MSNTTSSSSPDDAVASTDAPVSTSAALVGSLRRAREYWTPVRAKSAFLSKGVLTPEEFVKAGDELCHRCPTWTWECGDPNKSKSFLPPDKQFLITRGVPSTARVDSIEQSMTLTSLQDGDGDGDDGDDDWLVSNIIPTTKPTGAAVGAVGGDGLLDDGLEDDFDILDINEDGEVIEQQQQEKTTPSAPAPVPAPGPAAAAIEDYPEDEEYADMADFEDDNILMDDDQQQQEAVAGAGAAAATTANNNNTNMVPTRRYDISITYDKYYQTPRVWMTGFNEKSQPLSVDELMEDVVTDYRHKTVTMEPHPHSSGRQASIHPCQHSKVMKVIVHNLIKASSGSGDDDTDNDNETAAVDVTQYLFIFLKFVSSIIPTVNYDFTMDVQADTTK